MESEIKSEESYKPNNGSVGLAEIADGSGNDAPPIIGEPHSAGVSGSPIIRLLKVCRRHSGLVVAALSSFFIFLVLNFSNGERFLFFQNSIPTGGDMGAHIWGPAFLRDELLPNLSLTGWAPDWYQGFPAYRFYMVIPALAIVIVNVGLVWWVGLPLAIGLIFAVDYLIGPKLTKSAGNSVESIRSGLLGKLNLSLLPLRLVLMTFAIVGAAALVHIPYGIAFKLVAFSGVVLMPIAAWGMGRLARVPEPGPAFLAIGTLVFLFDANFTILGGNLLSTLAGEFSFSISFALVLLAIGMVIRSLDDRKWYGRTSIIIALAALSHVIPVFFLVPAIGFIVFANPKSARVVPVSGIALLLMTVVWLNPQIDSRIKVTATLIGLLAIISALSFAWNYSKETFSRFGSEFLLAARLGLVGFGIAAFWFIPFGFTGEIQGMFNDLGWIRETAFVDNLLTTPMSIAFPLAGLGFIISLFTRQRLGIVMSVMCGFFVLLYVNIGPGALWNQRLLPTVYLTAYLAAAIGLANILRFTIEHSFSLEVPRRRALAAFSFVALIPAVLGIMAVLGRAPLTNNEFINDEGEAVIAWAGFAINEGHPVQAWSTWNSTGIETKDHFREYRDVISTMELIGQEVGCGRAFWEFSPELDRFGTPMALMLLPHFTDGCIDSMEGLFFESSASTPFHFLNQSRLSIEPSAAQRFLPYESFDIDVGVDQMRASGIRYYLASNDQAIEAARNHSDLTEITAVSGAFPEGAAFTNAFAIFEHNEWAEAEGLDHLPVVVSGNTFEDIFVGGDDGQETPQRAEIEAELDEFRATLEGNGVPGQVIEDRINQERAFLRDELEQQSEFLVGWEGEAVRAYQNPAAYPALPAVDGPSDWPRTAVEGIAEERVLPSEFLSIGDSELLTEIDDPAVVSNYSTTRDTISFEVDQIGKPVIVRTSFFPNWNVDGAEGPWRVGPNQMVVVPTDTQVELSYGSSLLERGSYLITFTSLLGLFFVYRRRQMSAPVVEAQLLANASGGISSGQGKANVETASEEVISESQVTDESAEGIDTPEPAPLVEVLQDSGTTSESSGDQSSDEMVDELAEEDSKVKEP